MTGVLRELEAAPLLRKVPQLSMETQGQQNPVSWPQSSELEFSVIIAQGLGKVGTVEAAPSLDSPRKVQDNDGRKEEEGKRRRKGKSREEEGREWEKRKGEGRGRKTEWEKGKEEGRGRGKDKGLGEGEEDVLIVNLASGIT